MADRPNRLGQQLGNYRLLRLLGEGGFAEVYLAEHTYLGSHAAIKILSTRVPQDDIAQFQQEARMLVNLVHPHIVRVFDFSVDDHTPYLVMDYAPGGTLRTRHPKGTRLSVPTVVAYVKQCAQALQYVHDQKLIHRDIKPENMLIARNGDILLSDFGIALIAQSSRYQSTKDMAGTITYMAPEQIEAHPRPASDQYSLGIVVYEWLSGNRPFQGSFTEIAIKHSLTPPPSLCQQLPILSPEIEQIVFTALAKKPENRFASVRAFATVLEQASKPPVSPRKVTPSSQPEQKQLSVSLPVAEPSSQSSPPTVSVTSSNQIPELTAQAPPPSHSSHVSEVVPSTQLTSRPFRRTVIVGLVGLTLVSAGITWFATSRSSISSSSPTSMTPTTIPTPTPTSAPALTTYTGEGYTIGYPKGWTSKQDTSPKQFADLAKQSPGVQVPTTTFTDSLGVNTVTIGVMPDPNGTISNQTALNTVIQASKSSVKNYQEATIAAQATVGEQSWNQAAATGDVTQQGVTANAKTVALVTNYPAKSPTTKLYFIVYTGPSLTFDSIDSTDFQTILKSFKFS